MTLLKNRILGIDPGTQLLGYGILEFQSGLIRVLDCGVINLNKFEDDQTKLKEIFLQIQDLVEAFQTSTLSIELPFYGKNPQSMLKLGRAQGVAIAAAIVMGLDILEFSAKKIKKAVTGNGNASKEQVCEMIQRLLVYKIDSPYFDASDALAAAYCGVCHNEIPGSKSDSKAGSWRSFLSKNPERILK